MGIRGGRRIVHCILLEDRISLVSLCQSIQSIGFLTELRESALVYPAIMSTHLSCIAVFGGMILMIDMRLLGLALKKYAVTEVVSALRPWKRIGVCIMTTMGLLLTVACTRWFSARVSITRLPKLIARRRHPRARRLRQCFRY